jgi:hypothetical protein
MPRNDVRELEQLVWAKQRPPRPSSIPLGDEMVDYFNRTVRRRQTSLSAIAEQWTLLVPELLCDHCTLHGLSRGTLTVLVDSAVHLYELRQLLLAGLQQQILLACKAEGLRKIALKPGRPEDEQARRHGGT